MYVSHTGELVYDGLNGTRKIGHMHNPSYTYDEYLICIGLGPSISSVICKNLSYSGPSYPSSPVYHFLRLISIHKYHHQKIIVNVSIRQHTYMRIEKYASLQ